MPSSTKRNSTRSPPGQNDKLNDQCQNAGGPPLRRARCAPLLLSVESGTNSKSQYGQKLSARASVILVDYINESGVTLLRLDSRTYDGCNELVDRRRAGAATLTLCCNSRRSN
jgi:hypothetical protein